jgi:hypothetical protein
MHTKKIIPIRKWEYSEETLKNQRAVQENLKRILKEHFGYHSNDKEGNPALDNRPFWYRAIFKPNSLLIEKRTVMGKWVKYDQAKYSLIEYSKEQNRLIGIKIN